MGRTYHVIRPHIPERSHRNGSELVRDALVANAGILLVKPLTKVILEVSN